MTMTKTIGIIGGMGPAATLDLLTKIYASSTSESDQGHVRVLADIDPTIPDRTQAVLSGRRKEIAAHLLKNAQGLVRQGADLLAMPCNTAHAFIRELEQDVPVPFVNIVKTTVENIVQQGWKSVGLLATDGTLAARLYIDDLRDLGIKVLVPVPDEQAALMQAIYAFKGGEFVRSADTVRGIYRALLKAGAQKVIAACTELPILLAGQEQVVDPTDLLAKSLVRQAMGG